MASHSPGKDRCRCVAGTSPAVEGAREYNVIVKLNGATTKKVARITLLNERNEELEVVQFS